MKEEIKKLWVASLKSGLFAQGRGQLKIDNSYCCLGVLCDLHRRETSEGEWTSEDYYRIGISKSYTQLPCAVRDWAGLEVANPVIDGYSLSGHNDGDSDGVLTQKNVY